MTANRRVSHFLQWLLFFLTSSIGSVTSAADFQAQPGALTPKYSAEVVKENARQGKFLKIHLAKKPVTLAVFQQMVRKTMSQGGTAFAIGVVVDAQNSAWPNEELSAHIRAVWRQTVKLVNGDRAAGRKGYAELYGARVQAIVPVAYQPGLQLSASGGSERPPIPVQIDDLLIAINNHGYPLRSESALIATIEELSTHLERYLGSGRHWVTFGEYRTQEQAYLDGLYERVEQLNRESAALKSENEKLAIINKKIEGDQIQILLLRGMANRQTFSSATASGRENRRTVETYFAQHRLLLNKQRFDLIAMHDRYQTHAVLLYERACEVGDAESCTALAVSYDEGNGVERDPVRARILFLRACAGGDQVACRESGK